jgi:3-hydroxy acid dehydrogenase / malonic semialdehyde reductase
MSVIQDQTVLITGASSGIGAACARRFAEAGCRLILTARRTDRLAALAEELHSTDSVVRALDVTVPDGMAPFISELPETFRSIDVLINNAGLALGLDPVQAMPSDHIDRMVDTNVKGLLHVTRAVLPGMIARRRGHVINIGSTAGHSVYPGGTVYCATKHAVRAITEGLKMDVHGTPVRVSSVDPGMVETEFSVVRLGGDKEKAGAVYSGMTPLTAADVADAVLFCATRPPHVNISDIVLMPVDQSSPTLVHRSK